MIVRPAGIRDIVAPPAPALALAPDCFNDTGATGPACLVTLGPDTSLAERPGYDDVTGVGAATSDLVAELAKG